MKKVIVDEPVFELFPELQLNLLTVHGIDNHNTDASAAYFTKLLADATTAAHKFLTNDTFRLNPVVDQWRQAYRQFKTKKGARSSIEALLKRVSQGHVFTPINPLVDIYNSISLEFGVPVGGENLAKIVGDMHLGIAKGGESFWPLGADEDEPALPGEVCYMDDDGAICRCFNWREAQRTMLTPDTTDAVLVIESINNEQRQRAEAGTQVLKQRLADYFKVTAQPFVINHNNPSAELDY